MKYRVKDLKDTYKKFRLSAVFWREYKEGGLSNFAEVVEYFSRKNTALREVYQKVKPSLKESCYLTGDMYAFFNVIEKKVRWSKKDNTNLKRNLTIRRNKLKKKLQKSTLLIPANS